MKSNNFIKWLIVGLFALILILLAIVIFKRRDPIEPFNEKPYRDSISLLQKQILILHTENDSLVNKNFEIQNAKDHIKIIYREKYKFIHGATTNELDSIIRSNW